MIAVSQFFKNLIATLPGEVWTALGALAVWSLTTLTNRMSNAHAQKLLQAQLEHDSSERQREREHTLKREVYLPALEAGSQAMIILGRFCEPEVEVRVLNSELQAAYGKLAAAASLASVEAWTAVANYQRAVAALQLELAATRGPMNLAQLNLQYVREQASIALREQEALNAELRRSDERIAAQPGELERIQRAFRSATTLFENMQARGVEMERELGAAMVGTFSLLCDRLPDIADLGQTCIVALRAELGLPTDAAALAAAHEAMMRDSKSAIERIKARVKAELDERGSAS